jgi:2-keto-4-pentenoate hydratase
VAGRLKHNAVALCDACEMTEIADIAQALHAAETTRTAIAPLRETFGLAVDDVETGYAIQTINTERGVAAGRRITGRKIGLTSLAVQQQLGVDRPDFGVLFADMEFGEGDPLPMSRLIQPKAEAEVAIVLEHDLLAGRHHTFNDIVKATAYALASIEIVDSRITDWNIKFIDTVSDNASSGLYVLSGRPVPLRKVDLAAIPMTMMVNDQEVSQGSGAACLGHPINAARWLANALSSRGVDLYAGDVIMTGALGPMKPIGPGDRITANFGAFGTVSTSVSGA